MPVGDAAALLRIPGRLCIDPSDLSSDFPHGGTSLGLVREILVVVGRHTEEVTEEGLGTLIVLDELDLGESWKVRGFLAAPDQGVTDKLFMASEAGPVTGEVGIVYPGSNAGPGKWLGDRAVKLLFSPLDPAQWFLYFKRASVALEDEAELAKSYGVAFGAPFAFKALPPSSGQKVQWRPREDITL